MTIQSIVRAASCAFLLSFAASSMAATITVNSQRDDTDDDGDCTLREAVIAANTNSSSGSMPGECARGDTTPFVDQIRFADNVMGSIAITSSLPTVVEGVFINGPGPGILAINASNLSTGTLRIISVSSVSGSVTIAGLTFRNATTSSFSPITIGSPTTIRNCIFEDNQSDIGGAIESFDDLTVINSIFRRNTAVNSGGGAIALRGSENTLVIETSRFEDNLALGGAEGGAIVALAFGHITQITSSTFIQNRANNNGGAIAINGESLNIENSTFIGNIAGRNGGAIRTGTATVLANATITGNTADENASTGGDGGGLFQLNSNAQITVRNSIIADNIDGSSVQGFGPDCAGEFISDGYNLIGNLGSDCSGFADDMNGDQVGSSMSPIDPGLETLADNGGLTPTLALQVDSPAVAAGNPMGCHGVDGMSLNVDQRGEPRPAPVGSPCDIGAFELDQPLPMFNLTVSIIGTGSGRVSSSPSGINCPNVNCSVDFYQGAVVDLTAQAATGSVFAEWSGDCNGTGTCQVTMDRMRSVTAEFAPDVQALTVSVNGAGRVASSPVGIDCPGDCSQDYSTGTQVTLDAVADSGFRFDGWSGDCSGMGTCQVSMDQRRSIEAAFSPIGFTLEVSIQGTGSGTVTSAPIGINCPVDCSEEFDKGQSVSLLPAPDAGFFFQNWAGDCIGDGMCDLSMNEDKQAIAIFLDDDTLFIDSFE